MDYVKVKDHDKGYGPLRWFGNSRDAVSVGAALLGRGCAIYDMRMDYATDLEKLAEDLSFRSTVFRSVNIWAETENAKVRRAWALACYDHPGKGRDSVMEADVTLEELQKWYDFEMDGLTDCILTDKVLKSLWGGDFVQLSKDLNVHGRIIHIFRNWGQVPGSDYHKVMEYAFLKTLHMDHEGIGGDILSRGKETYVEEEALPYRQMFIESWRKAEDCLLSYPAPKRVSVNLEKEI